MFLFVRQWTGYVDVCLTTRASQCVTYPVKVCGKASEVRDGGRTLSAGSRAYSVQRSKEHLQHTQREQRYFSVQVSLDQSMPVCKSWECRYLCACVFLHLCAVLACTVCINRCLCVFLLLSCCLMHDRLSLPCLVQAHRSSAQRSLTVPQHTYKPCPCTPSQPLQTQKSVPQVKHGKYAHTHTQSTSKEFWER